MATMQELLGGPNLSGLIQKMPSGIPLAVPAEFATPSRRNIGPNIDYFLEVGTRNLAQVIHYDAPPRSDQRLNLAKKVATGIHSSHFHDYGPMDYQNFMAPDGSQNRVLGEYELARQTRSLKQKFVNLRYAAIQRALVDGVLYFDGDGHMLPSSSGAVFTVDYAVPAGHKAQLNVYGTGAIISASWATASTDIPTQIAKILDAALERTGLPITHALYGNNILTYLLGNDYVKQLITANPALAATFAARQIPDGFLGINKWYRVGSAFYYNSSNALVKIFGDDAIVFTPDVSQAWWELVECSYVVPKELGVITPDAIAAAGFAETVFGMYGYAKLKDEPVSIRQICGDTFLPMLINNLAIFSADVTP